MRAVWRWTRRIVLGLLALVVLSVGGVLIALHTDWGRDKVRAQIEAKLKPYFPAGARIGRLEGSLLGDFTLHDIELIDREGRKAVTIRKVTINVKFSAYFDGEYRIEQLIVEGVRVAMHQQGQEPPNVATMFQPNPDPLPANVVIEHLAVRDADFVIDKDGRVDHLDDLTLDSAVFLAREGPFAMEVRLGAQWRERKAPVRLSGAVQSDVRGIMGRELHVGVGDVTLDGRGLRYAGIAGIRGRMTVRAPEGALQALVPELQPPRAAVALDLDVGPVGVEQVVDGRLGVSVRGSLGRATVDGVLVAHPLAAEPALAGTIHLHDLDASLASPTAPPTDVDGALVLSLWLDEKRHGLAAVRGMAALDARGRVDKLRFDRVTGAAVLDGRGGDLRLEARGDGDTAVDITARLAVDQDDEIIHVLDGRLVAHSRSLGRAAQGHVAVRGALDADLRFDGRIGGDGAEPSFAVTGRVSGRGLRYDSFAVETAALDVALEGLPAAPSGSASVAVTGARAGTSLLPNARIQVRGRRGGDLDVIIDAVDAELGLQATIAGTIVQPDLTSGSADVRLRSYDVRGRGLHAVGKGGRALLTPERVTISGVRGTVAGGSFAIDGSMPRPAGPGAVGARGEIALVDVDLAKLRGMPGLPALLAGSATVRAKLDRGRARLDLEVRDPQVGELVLGLEVIPPRRALDPAAWSSLDRRAIKALHVDAKGFDLAAAGKMLDIDGLEGHVDGNLHLDGADRRGAIELTGVVAAGLPAPLDATVKIGLDDPAVTRFDVDATLRDLGRVQVSAGLRVPVNIFDPAAWRRVGVGAVDGATLRIDDFTVDEAMATRLGLGDVRGQITASLTATRGLATLDGDVVVRDFTAGPLREPIGVTVELGTADGIASAHAVATLHGQTVLEIDAHGELDVVRALRRGLDPRRIPINGTVTIPDMALAPVIQALGQSAAQARRLSGQVRGSGKLSGTIGAPIAEGELTIVGLGSRVPRGGGAVRGGVRELKISGRYDRGRIVAGVRGKGDDDGTFALDTKLDLARPEAAASTLVANKFQLRPIARLMPEVLLGVSGVLDADLRLAGIDPKTAVISGEAQLSGVTLPINDVVGVLRNGSVSLDFDPRKVHAVVSGGLESGRIDMVADATLDGLVPIDGKVEVLARGLELITASAPRVDGKLVARFKKEGERWVVNAAVRDGVVRERSSKGRVLHPSGVPLDMVFASTEPGAKVPEPRGRAVRTFVGEAPEAPFLEMELVIEDVSATTELVRGDITGKFNVAVGNDGATIRGKVEVERGDVEVYARRYRINRAVVSFDGGVDPVLDLQLERELPQLTLRVSITERLSNPKILFSSDPGGYTQGQLLSFALSDSAAAPGRESVDAATNLFAAIASQTLVDYVKPFLPVDLDVIAYEPPTASSSAAYVAGKWIRRKLLVQYRSRPEARNNENVHEGEAEYWINRHILLEATGGNRRVFGADLLWTKRW